MPCVFIDSELNDFDRRTGLLVGRAPLGSRAARTGGMGEGPDRPGQDLHADDFCSWR